jgi:murein DD-endopeptidase / murein LD-carboxypeptidase
MKKWINIFILTILCSTNLKAQDSVIIEDNITEDYLRSYCSQSLGIELNPKCNLLLYDTLTNWIGTPYRFAGNSTNGIDCSGFVNKMYDHVFGLKIGARNSGEIYNMMQKLDVDELKEGDLVFFRIRKGRISHVGLYLGNNKFAHSSTSNGVIISDLSEGYYKRYFAGAGRHKEGTFENISSNKTEY